MNPWENTVHGFGTIALMCLMCVFSLGARLLSICRYFEVSPCFLKLAPSKSPAHSAVLLICGFVVSKTKSTGCSEREIGDLWPLECAWIL